MNRYAYTYIAHQGLAHCNPISDSKMEDLIDAMRLAPDADALDIGCGKAELLIRLGEECGSRGVGYERSPLMAAEARVQAERRVPGLIEIREQDATGLQFPEGSFDIAACLGASEALGGAAAAISTLASWVHPGGRVVIAEGFWEQPPAAEYLAATGIEHAEFSTHAANLERGRAAGLIPMWAGTANADEWDRYEWHHAASLERHARANPGDPEAAALRDRSRAWLDAYNRWGRGTLGFGVYLFLKP